jgi:acyl-CoA synthetase (AMP-forming)/AMP-acid ligase II
MVESCVPTTGHTQRHIIETLSRPECDRCRVQLITRGGTRESTFGEMWRLSTYAGGALQSLGPRGRVAGIVSPSVEMIACLVGTLRAGRDFVSVPLPARGQDLVAYARQLRCILDAANADTFVVEATYAVLLKALPVPIQVGIIAAEELAQRPWPLQGDPIPGELVQFSSGTTGEPKGVRLSGRAISASVEATLDGIGIAGTPEVYCGWVPLSHDMGLIGGLFGSWSGCTRTQPGYQYTCISPELFLERPRCWMDICAAIGATVTAGPTFAYDVLARQMDRGPPLDLSRLRACIIGAEPIGATTLSAFTETGRRHGIRERSLCPAYGLAEMCLCVSMVPPGASWSTRAVTVDGHRSTFVSCGRVLSCARVQAPASAIGAGPIRLAGPAACSGYVPEQSGASDGWIDTGDLGVVCDDGELVIAGRSDDVVCVAGRNLFAWQLEGVACSLPAVRSGNCAVVSDGRGGYVVLFELRASQTPDASELHDVFAELRRRLASVAGAGPSAAGCLPRGHVLKTPSGKIRRSRMAAELPTLARACLAYKQF